jgi:hypothetical protein
MAGEGGCGLWKLIELSQLALQTQSKLQTFLIYGVSSVENRFGS